jgi:WD40 repeat protein
LRSTSKETIVKTKLFSILLIAIILAGCGSPLAAEPGAQEPEAQASSAPAVAEPTAAEPTATAEPTPGEVITAENVRGIELLYSRSGHPCDFSVAFSRDSQRVVSTGCQDDHKVRVWELATDTEVEWEHEGAGFGTTYSPDGAVLAVWGLGPNVRLYDAASGTLLRTLQHSEFVFDVEFSPDGTVIAGAGGDGMIVRWEFASGAPMAGYLDPAGGMIGVSNIAYAPDGWRIASADQDGHLRIWDVATSSVVIDIDLPDVAAVNYSANGSVFAAMTQKINAMATGSERVVTVYDAVAGARLHSFGGGEDSLRGYDLSPDGNLLATVLEDGTIVIYDVASGGELHRFAGGAEYVDVVVFSPDGRLLASEPRYADENRVEVWGIKP